jgi:hypothetical protein
MVLFIGTALNCIVVVNIAVIRHDDKNSSSRRLYTFRVARARGPEQPFAILRSIDDISPSLVVMERKYTQTSCRVCAIQQRERAAASSLVLFTLNTGRHRDTGTESTGLAQRPNLHIESLLCWHKQHGQSWL